MWAFWPFATVLMLVLAPLMMGVQEAVSSPVLWVFLGVAAILLVWSFGRAVRHMRWPSQAEAVARVDARLPGRPIAALNDTQAVGAGDAASEEIWQAHLTRMEVKTHAATAVRPDVRLRARDPFGLRYMALLCFAVALIFGSLWRVGSVSGVAPGSAEAAVIGPVWEGWIEPPAYTGKPTLYLPDLRANRVQVPQGAFVTLRLYGDAGELSVTETVSGGAAVAETTEDGTFGIAVEQAGTLSIDGAGGASWAIDVIEDAPPAVQLIGAVEVEATGEMAQPFAASDDYGVVAGTATFDLNLSAVDRRYGLAPTPDPRGAILLDLPLPFTGDLDDFDETLIDDFSQHPWANLPVRLTMQVEDAQGQTGASETIEIVLPGRRFFQPIARAVIEQRRDLMWARDNAQRVAQVLRAVSHRPEDFFPSQTVYLRLRQVIRQLEAYEPASLTDDARDEIATALWEIAIELEEGALADAKARLERAQERLEEAMRNGASEEEIAELMQELREATQDYLNMLAQQAEPAENQTDQPDTGQDGQNITNDEIQALMDRIQELMEEGRMAEAMALMDQLNELLQNLQMTQSEGGEGGFQTPGEQAMEELSDTLRDQQDLNDDAFEQLQDQFNPGQPSQEQQGGQRDGQQDGQQPGQQGQDGQQGQNPSSGGQQGQGAGQGDNTQGGLTDDSGAGGEGSSDPGGLADRQQALRDGLDQLRDRLPGLQGDAAERAEQALDRAEGAMDDAEEALRQNDLAQAIDRQADALDSLRDGLRNLGQALAENQMAELPEDQGTQPGGTDGRPEPQRRDPLGRQMGETGQYGTEENMLQDDINRRAEALLRELRDRSADQGRPQLELDYLRRLLERF